ncbi:hypothetical protein VTN49DRAFT_3715 [Thermomyces lanuginosus]|uniref:uncharacterized protein n=1 Tax=Thermomyces lanuginosus TaxID=5541 RepID=UPI0037424683
MWIVLMFVFLCPFCEMCLMAGSVCFAWSGSISKQCPCVFTTLRRLSIDVSKDFKKRGGLYQIIEEALSGDISLPKSAPVAAHLHKVLFKDAITTNVI